MKSVSGKALCKIVERYGSHHIYGKDGFGVILSIPVHSNRDLPTGTLKSLLKDAGLTEENLN